ncbi:MAG TPA: xanthine dehydrogenase molybdopterin binding subunit [Salinivirgaceae bacterium]|nr:xanthine dehydrogenase molybdopterin binding subunit [Salinivirgaceae bacterium]
MKNPNYHNSAIQHVTGKAQYIGDMSLSESMLIGRVFYSPVAHARILHYDLSEAMKVPGVIDILDFTRIPGENQLNPIANDEPCLAEKTVQCIGQAIFLIAAENEDAAVEAERKIYIDFEPLPAILSIQEAMAKNNKLAPTRKFEKGTPDIAFQTSQHQLEGELYIGGQEHWYLETQASIAIPLEDGGMKIYSSSQNPTETQLAVAEVLGLPAHSVECEVLRMGGAFSGKESQASHFAAWTALIAHAAKRPVKLVLHRDDDQKITGKRHRYYATYKIGFTSEGEITAYIVDLNSDAGCATDLSMAILERSMFHAENAYYIPNVRITATAWKTNLPSNTAFRGFGGPQGMAVIENAIDRMAHYLGKDAAEIRLKNFYTEQRNETPYGQIVTENRLHAIYPEIIKKSEYFQRRQRITEFNLKHQYQKRGLALTPVKFGISFTTSFLNQAGALVVIYKDGTVLINHGGTEMGQGLHTKIKRIAAEELGLEEYMVKVNATNTSKVPNTSPTAASSGTDLNGMAVKNAIETIKNRLTPVAIKMIKEKFKIETVEELIYKSGTVYDSRFPDKYITFAQLTKQAHFEQVSLSATGFYKTPEIFFDKSIEKGKPFHYYAYGMAVSEVEIDLFTGRSTILSVHIIHDVGNSINHDIDMGQVAGGFIQGMGWVTMEKLRYNEKGELLNYSPDTYKIPTIGDLPKEFSIELLEGYPNPKAVMQSKAVGEPPFMLAFSVWLAIKDAISAVGNHKFEPPFELPANAEIILLATKSLQEKSANLLTKQDQ